MSQPRPTDPIGSIGWTERTGGVLTARECLTLARPCCGVSSAFLPAVSQWCSGCTRDAAVPSIRRVWWKVNQHLELHHTPGVGLESGAEAYLLSAGASV